MTKTLAPERNGTGQNNMIFLGQHSRTIDHNGRLVIPVEFRPALGRGATITRSFDSCLCIYPTDEWEAMAAALRDFPQVRPETRDLARSIFGGASGSTLDVHGRITIPPYLREFANLRDEVRVIGVNGHVEVWSEELWQQKQPALGGQDRFLDVLAASGA